MRKSPSLFNHQDACCISPNQPKAEPHALCISNRIVSKIPPLAVTGQETRSYNTLDMFLCPDTSHGLLNS